MQLAHITDPHPLRQDEHGVIRIGQTRVALQSIVYLFDQGASAEEIALRFDALSLAEVYASSSFYLSHREQVLDYVETQRQASEQARQQAEQHLPSSMVRARLLQRRRA